MTINHLPASHFFGAGFGLDQKKAFWAASRSIVRRLYHAGFITPVLYHTIGKFRICLIFLFSYIYGYLLKYVVIK